MARRGNGEGSISRRKSGGWMAQYWVELADGRRQRKSIYGHTRVEVSRRLSEAIAARDGGIVYDVGNLTVGEYLDGWLVDSVEPMVAAGKLAYSTFIRYRGIVRKHLLPALGRTKLKSLTRPQIRRLYAEKAKTLSPRSVDYIHITLQRALGQAVRDDLIGRNVASGERPQSSRHRKEVKALTSEQVQALMREIHGEHNEALYVVAVHTGLRQGEILGLKWTDIDLDARRLSVRRALKKVEGGWGLGPPKNSASRRSVPLSKTASAALRSHRTRQNEERPHAPGWKDHGLVFPSRVGTPADRGNVYRVEYLPLLERAGLGDEGFTFHTLRHTFASELFRQGRRPKVIQTLLGHSSIMQTMDTYSHLLDGVDDDEVGGLDDAFGV